MNVQSAVQMQLNSWHSVLDSMVSECDAEALGKEMPGATVTSIGSVYAHIVLSEDGIVNGLCQGKPTVYETGGWKDTIDIPFDGTVLSPDWARGLKLDVATFREYAKAVYTATDAYIANLPDAELERKVQTPIGEQTVGWALVALLATHLPQHAGEIAALKGVQGLKGLPF
ncbi:MAG: DinB family protein [Dehalococcoidia bacterium]